MENLSQAPAPHHDASVPVIVIAALVIGGLGGYAYGLGKAEQLASRTMPVVEQAASVAETFAEPVIWEVSASTTVAEVPFP